MVVLAAAGAVVGALIAWLAYEWSTRKLTPEQKTLLNKIKYGEGPLNAVLESIKKDEDELIKLQYQLAKDYKGIKTDQDKKKWDAEVERFEIREKAVNDRRKRYFDVKYPNKPEETIIAAVPVAPAA